MSGTFSEPCHKGDWTGVLRSKVQLLGISHASGFLCVLAYFQYMYGTLFYYMASLCHFIVLKCNLLNHELIRKRAVHWKGPRPRAADLDKSWVLTSAYFPVKSAGPHRMLREHGEPHHDGFQTVRDRAVGFQGSLGALAAAERRDRASKAQATSQPHLALSTPFEVRGSGLR